MQHKKVLLLKSNGSIPLEGCWFFVLLKVARQEKFGQTSAKADQTTLLKDRIFILSRQFLLIKTILESIHHIFQHIEVGFNYLDRSESHKLHHLLGQDGGNIAFTCKNITKDTYICSLHFPEGNNLDHKKNPELELFNARRKVKSSTETEIGKARCLRRAARAAAAEITAAESTATTLGAGAVAIASIDNSTADTNVDDAMDQEGVEWLNDDGKALRDLESPELHLVEENDDEFIMHIQIGSDKEELPAPEP